MILKLTLLNIILKNQEDILKKWAKNGEEKLKKYSKRWQWLVVILIYEYLLTVIGQIINGLKKRNFKNTNFIKQILMIELRLEQKMTMILEINLN